MSFAKCYSAQTSLLRANIITVETDISRGLFSFSIVGLPDKAVEEARDRVSAAIKNSGFDSPKNRNQKVIISLAPADVKKEGPIFDLAVALSYLKASEILDFDPDKKLFLGELSLDGILRPIRGVLPLVEEAQRLGFEEIFVPEENVAEAGLVDNIKIYGIKSLGQIVEHLLGKEMLSPAPKTEIVYKEPETLIDFADVRGQETAKRGLEIAAAGGHNIAMYGPPGTGKTMLARAFTRILPALEKEDMFEATAIHSVAGTLSGWLVTHPPFRSPHHTSSHVALVGGGNIPRPGEITLAHKGVLFLDEFPEFERRVIDSLREPLESRVISVSRAKGTAEFPAHFILVAAMNPCPCGYKDVPNKECVCSPIAISRYERKISGPIMDRIDIWVEVSRIEHAKLGQGGTGEKSEKIKERIAKAREIQKKRFLKTPIKLNSEMNVKQLETFTPLLEEVRNILNVSAEKLDLSPRAYHRIIKIARTIADLEDSLEVRPHHILEALQYRPKKRTV